MLLSCSTVIPPCGGSHCAGCRNEICPAQPFRLAAAGLRGDSRVIVGTQRKHGRLRAPVEAGGHRRRKRGIRLLPFVVSSCSPAAGVSPPMRLCLLYVVRISVSFSCFMHILYLYLLYFRIYSYTYIIFISYLFLYCITLSYLCSGYFIHISIFLYPAVLFPVPYVPLSIPSVMFLELILYFVYHFCPMFRD